MHCESSIRPAEAALKSLVSIIINNYNYGRFIADAIDSALAQTYSNCEVIVVDDGSQDNSREVISRFGNRVKTVFKSNGGQSSAFNAGFAESRGEVICFLDSDDVFLPTKVERMVDGLDTCPEGWCFHHIQWSDTGLKPIFTPPIPYSTGKYDFRSSMLEGKCRFAPPATSGLGFTRILLNQLMPIPEFITITSDNYLKLSALALAPGFFIAEQYTLQRIHGGNSYTGRTDEMMIANVDMLIALGLRAKVPAMRSICNRWYAAGIVRKWGAGATIGNIYRDTQVYLTDVPFSERMEIVARIAYKAARRKANSLAKARL
jgi:glycosyltransferase involved in cell wall biosynthesis